MSHLVQVIILVGIAVGAWYFLRPHPKFVIVIREGKPTVAQGQVTRKLLHDVADVCNEFGVNSGRISGFVVNRRISLTFQHILTEHHQRFRNVFHLHG